MRKNYRVIVRGAESAWSRDYKTRADAVEVYRQAVACGHRVKIIFLAPAWGIASGVIHSSSLPVAV